MIPRLKPTLGSEEIRAAVRKHRGNDVVQFEEDFARLMNQRFAVAFPYGRTGLIALFHCLGIKHKEVICPAYTCVVVAHAIIYSGNTPVFVDCKPGEFNMDLDKVEENITEKTGAIIATSLFGYPVDLDTLNRISEKYPTVLIIQDCAHSFKAEWKGRPVQKEGVAALFGLNISKTITSIFGGMVTTDKPKLYRELVKFRKELLAPADRKKAARRLVYLGLVYISFLGSMYGMVNRMERSGLLGRYVQYYDERRIDMPEGYLKKMTGVEARVGRVNLKRYDTVIERRRASAKYYFQNLGERLGFILPPQKDGATYSHFVIRVSYREKWLRTAIDKGVQLGWLIEYSIPTLASYQRFAKSSFPVSEEYARSAINLPTWGGASLAKEVVSKLF